MKSKPRQRFFKQQLLGLVSRKLRKVNYSMISLQVSKQLGLSIIVFLTIPTALVKAQQPDKTWRWGRQQAQSNHYSEAESPAVLLAQITPDRSLPTSIEQQGAKIKIEGGAREGNNLFHSFENFSVPENIEAIFNNAAEIDNIFSRITGESASIINGILKTQGSANLFLVNPNGIVFGENAQLDVGVSFLATTAEGIQFRDGTEFSALRGQEKPILTVSVPIGLEFGNSPGAITVQGRGNNVISDPQTGELITDNRPVGLQVKSGKTLALVGGNISLEGGNLTAEEGTIELGSVGSRETVKIMPGNSEWKLNYQGVEKFQDIQLSQAASADASGSSGSSIRVQGRQVNLVEDSIIFTETLGNSSGGIISVKASLSIDLITGFINNNTKTAGQADDIVIKTKNLRVTDGSQIINATFGPGNSGNIIVIAENIEVRGANPLAPDLPSLISANVFLGATGNGGDVTIKADRLSVSNSGNIQASTLGSGDTGNIDVIVSDLEISVGNSLGASGLATLSFPGATGNVGDLTISAERLFLGEQTQLSTVTFGGGDGGDLTIFADEIELTGSSLSSGRSGLFASALIGNGNGGNINVSAELLTIKDGATISTSNFQSLNLELPGTGSPGNININAETILLSEGSISANTLEGDRGNIILDADNILLIDGSQITIDAERTNGGNLNIDTDSLTVLDGSVISANADVGEGGNIQINTTGLFQDINTIIEASSELGIDGTVQINTPDINLQKELELSEIELFTADRVLANSCLALRNQPGNLTLGGDSGLPKNPNSHYSDADFSLTGVGSLPTPNPESVPIRGNSEQQNLSIIPAAFMVKTEEGRIFLVAAPQKAESFFCQSFSEQDQ